LIFNLIFKGYQLKFDGEFGLSLHVFKKNISSFASGTLENDEIEDIPLKEHEIDFQTKTGLEPNLNSYTITKKGAIRFRRSHETQDAAQTMVPFFDGSDIVFDKPAPISSIGLFRFTNHITRAGFITPAIRSLNYKKLMRPA
jgi:hypothetical protein